MALSTPSFKAAVLTLFPDMFPGPLGQSLAGKALLENIWRLDVVNIRDYAADKHKTVDDTPFGGGPGMVMRADVLDAALNAVSSRDEYKDAPKIYFSPRGKKLTQEMAKRLAEGGNAILLCGRYEGIDERVIEKHGLLEVSAGDVVLSGGEIPALMLLDAVLRLLPGVLGASETLLDESFENNLLEYPHYTRPQNWEGIPVPDVLSSGNHAKIKEWRKSRAEEITRARRPDLWKLYEEAQALAASPKKTKANLN